MSGHSYQRKGIKKSIDDIIELLSLHSVLNRANLGFKTVLGENGVNLSGGEKQRIGIARALTREADVLILDEATSALDTNLETKIMQQLIKKNRNKTIIMIAHRVSTLKYCNRILEMDAGKMTRELTYEELIAT